MQTNSIYGKPKSNHQQTPTLSTTCTAYHDYRFEWTPTYIAWVVDGKEIRRDTGADATAYAQNASAGMTFHFNIWPGNASFGGNINNTTLPVHQYISWVQYSSYDNGNFTVQWREEFQASGVPSGWAVGNWSSPYNLSTHNTQNVAFVNGIGVLSLTADNATGAPGTPPADSASTGTGGSSGTGGTTSTGGGSGGATSGAGGTTGTGGSKGMGGTTSTTSAGGTTGPGGSTTTGGRTSTGGTSGLGGTSATSAGGTTSSGGTIGSGGSTGGASGAGGTTASGGASGASASDGGSRSGGTTGAGGTTASGGTTATGAGGTTTSGGTTATGGDATGGTSGPTATDAGCGCSTAPAANPPWLVLMALSVVVLFLRRKEI
jgi:MYXO-CTERM domain-containing protein